MMRTRRLFSRWMGLLVAAGVAAGHLISAPSVAIADGESRLLAQAETDKAPPPRSGSKRPPKRSETKEKKSDRSSLEIDRKARYVGPVRQLPSGRPPQPQLYPMIINRRSFPDPQTITVELAVKNASGQHWKTAYVALRSARMDQAELFEIQDWALDEVVGIDYTFPRNQLNDRLRKLRIVSISGEQRQSALAELLARNRQRYVNLVAPEEELLPADRAGDTLEAPGALALLASLQSPFTGLRVDPIAPEVVLSRPIKVNIPDRLKLPAEPPMQTSGSSQQMRKLRGMMEEFHRQGRATQDSLQEFIRLLGTAPYQEAMETGGREALKGLRQELRAFNAAGVMFSQAIRQARRSDSGAMDLMSMVVDYSRKIKQQIERVEGAVSPYDADFEVQKAAGSSAPGETS